MTTSKLELSTAQQRISTLYDPRTLEAASRRVMTLLVEHFHSVESGDAKVLNWNPPTEQIALARQFMDESNVRTLSSHDEPSNGRSHASWLHDRIAQLTRDSLARGQNLHHPRYVGHQVPPPIPLAALFDLVGVITNQCMAIYEMGPWATAVEHAVIDAVGERLGFAPGRFAGLVTSGGSLANLTGLLTARNVTLGDVWSTGFAGRKQPPVMVTHADAHYCVTRSAGILGLGTNQIIRASLDDRRRIDPNRLDELLRDLRARDVPIVAVAAAACATPIGAFDPLNDISDVCSRHDVWLHVDAAHGGALAFSDKHRHLITGIEKADSVVCDAHKMMFMPALCAMLFYKNREHRMAAFQQDAPYLFDPTAAELRDYDSGIVNLECTKRAAAFGLWGIWSMMGPQILGDLVDVTIDQAQKFYTLISGADDFETLHEPQCNIVAFRFIPPALRNASHDEQDSFQLKLRRSVIESGQFYFVQTRIDGRSVLRTTMMNPLTTEEDLRALLDCIRRTADRLLSE